MLLVLFPSVLWHCWLGGRKGIRLVKTEWWGAGMVICLERGADLHMAQLMTLPLTVSCFSKIQIGFTFRLPAHLGSAGQRAVKRVCVCVFFYTAKAVILLLECYSSQHLSNYCRVAKMRCFMAVYCSVYIVHWVWFHVYRICWQRLWNIVSLLLSYISITLWTWLIWCQSLFRGLRRVLCVPLFTSRFLLFVTVTVFHES